MKPILPTRSLRPRAAMLLAAAAFMWVQIAHAQSNRQPSPNSAGAPGTGYAQPHAQRPYGGGSYPAARPNNGYTPPGNSNGPNNGYARSNNAYAHPGNGYAQPDRNFGAQSGPQSAYPQQPQQNGYSQRPYPQTNGYGQRGYGQNNGYGQYQDPAQAQNRPAQGQNGTPLYQNRPTPQAVPNRNASYGGINQQPMRQNPQGRFWQQQPDGLGANATHGEHLEQWMQHHNNLNTQDQQRALTREPGFSQLPQQTQQRMLDRLQHLNSMPAEQRERTLQRSEQMERLSPAQRGEVRNAMGDLGALPQDRRRAVAHSFRELRPLTPEQRNQMLNSPGYRQQFSDQERNTLNNLLNVSPMLPQQ